MKQLLVSLFYFLLFNNITEAQQSPTFAGPPGPDNVLVVYSSNSDTSLMVANYYKTARGIPASNIIGLDNFSNHDITIDGVTHPVIIAEQGNIIRDELNHEWGTWYATQHAWKYFYQYIAAPIKQHIAANNLNSIDTGNVLQRSCKC
jgi:hypothetical protein